MRVYRLGRTQAHITKEGKFLAMVEDLHIIRVRNALYESDDTEIAGRFHGVVDQDEGHILAGKVGRFRVAVDAQRNGDLVPGDPKLGILNTIGGFINIKICARSAETPAVRCSGKGRLVNSNIENAVGVIR